MPHEPADTSPDDVPIRGDVDARRLAIEVIATLVHIKKSAADLVLRRAGVPEDLIRRFLTERDTATGSKRSKREAGATLLQELAVRDFEAEIVKKIIALAANWTEFHLANDEYHARAVVQKAREMLNMFEASEARAIAEAERSRRARAEAQNREARETVTQQSALLLAQFEQAATSGDPHQRGFLLEDLLNRVFDLHGITVHRSFRRNEGGEQIDGAFILDGWHYIVECRWRQRLADIRQLDGLAGQVARSGRQTMGMFLSVEGWSEHVVPLLKQNPDKVIFLMEGFDFRSILDQRMDLRTLLKAKIAALNIEAEPYLSVTCVRR
jgi:hypothetical protein